MVNVVSKRREYLNIAWRRTNMLFKGFGQSCGEYSSAEIQNEMFFKY